MSSFNPLYSLSGFVVGILVGQTGVGGGSLMTPLLVLLFGVHPATAVGTDLLYASATKTIGTLVHGYNGTVDWKVTRRLAYGSLPATVATILLISRFDLAGSGAGRAISFVLGIALLLTAIALVFRPKLIALAGDRLHLPDRKIAALTVVTGAVLGALVTLSSVGAGAVGVTALLLLYPLLPTKRIVGSDIAHAVPLTLVAGIGHWMLGSVDWSLLAALLTGSIPGIILGSYLSSRVPDMYLRPILAAVLALVGGRLVF
ncbi:MAG: sulfite exporter TauE/SafE family protein [Proteobacteria bacterium]|nr:sulfite exporter TauE/SafE family protein [Pseudomonadota bacterium]